MIIISSFKISDEKQDELRREFPQGDFRIYQDIHSAQESLSQAEILLTYGEDLTPEHIREAQSLKWIMVVSAGLEKMPFEAIRERGIMVTNAKGIHRIPMAEYTMSMILQTARNSKTIIENEKNHKWDRSVKMVELHGQTVLILGVGAIGGEIARLAKAFNMKTLGINTSGRPVDFVDEVYTMECLDEIIGKADIIVSVLPSTGDTKHLLKASHFDKMNSHAVFINIGRGDLVKEEVLLEALTQQKLAHAVLDVFETEPLPSDHPFWEMENVTVTPHFSSITKNYLPRAFEIFEHNLKVYLKGEQDFRNIIDPSRGY